MSASDEGFYVISNFINKLASDANAGFLAATDQIRVSGPSQLFDIM